MAVNRRNFYRLLHVQPEAPEPVITASYRAMMSKLRLHPDLGGDTESAQLINEAYGVLRDPAKRALYDARLKMRKAGSHSKTASSAAPADPSAPARAPAARTEKPQTVLRVANACAFCQAPVPHEIMPQTRCGHCDSPLAAPPPRPVDKNELFGRRAVPRMSRTDAVRFLPAWQMPALNARLRDLSMSGIRVVTNTIVAKGQVIRITGPLFDIVATVVGCRTDGRRVEIHAALLTAIFMNPKGVVVSVRT
jgi:curved DNA-binding protein CbpA